MQQADYVALIRSGVPNSGGVWADFGSGQGAYTLALAELLGPGSTIYSIDTDASALATQAKLMAAKFPEVKLHQVQADFTVALTPALPALDGLIIANALHLVPDHQKPAVVKLLKGYLKPGGRLLLVDYNADHGNNWVPYPMAYARWEQMAKQAGFETVRLLGTFPNNFLKEFYAAENVVPQPPPPAPKPVAAPAKAPAPAQKAEAPEAAAKKAPTAKPAATKKKAATKTKKP